MANAKPSMQKSKPNEKVNSKPIVPQEPAEKVERKVGDTFTSDGVKYIVTKVTPNGYLSRVED